MTQMYLNQQVDYKVYWPMTKPSWQLDYLTSDFFIKGWKMLFQEDGALILALCLSASLMGHHYNLGLEWTAWGCLVILLMRKMLAGGVCSSARRLDGKVAVITGATSGIGKETAMDLSARGATVVLGCRDLKKADKVATKISAETGGVVTVFKLDLASLASVRNFADQLRNKYPRIHFLINNAGVMMSPESKTEDGFEMQMGTNYFGPFLLTNLLLPLLKHGEQTRIINVSSVGHYCGKIPFGDWNYEREAYDRMGAYANSSLAIVTFTRQLAKELEGTNVQVFAVNPGWVRTQLSRYTKFGEVSEYFSQFFSKSPIQGAQPVIHCVTEATTHHFCYFSDCVPLEPHKAAMDESVCKRLWEESERKVGLSR